MKRTIIISILAMLLLSNVASASFVDDLDQSVRSAINKITHLTFFSYSKDVPIQIGSASPTSYWVISGNVGWAKDTLFLFKLPAGTTYTSGSDILKTQKPVEISFAPIGVYETATLTKSVLVTGWAGSEAYYIDPIWRGSTVYEVTANGQTKTVTIDMNSPNEIAFSNGIYVDNLGILPRGINPPSGDLIWVKNGKTGAWGVYRHTDVQVALNAWHSDPISLIYGSYYDWWNWMEQKGSTPTKPNFAEITIRPIQNNYLDFTALEFKYPMASASSVISAKIPASLADVIVVKIGASKPVLISKTDPQNVQGGQQVTFNVVVRNDGGDDYVTVKGSGAYDSVTPVTKFMIAGSTTTFNMVSMTQSSATDTSANINMMIDGTDPYYTDPTFTVTHTIYSSSNNANYKLTVIPKSPAGAVLSNAPIKINGVQEFTGQNYVVKPAGTYEITSENTGTFYAPTPKSVNLNSDTTVELQFSDAPQGEDMTWIFWGIIGIVLLVILAKLNVLQMITKNPAMLIVLIVLLFILYFLWQLFSFMVGVTKTIDDVWATMPWNWFK